MKYIREQDWYSYVRGVLRPTLWYPEWFDDGTDIPNHGTLGSSYDLSRREWLGASFVGTPTSTVVSSPIASKSFKAINTNGNHSVFSASSGGYVFQANTANSFANSVNSKGVTVMGWVNGDATPLTSFGNVSSCFGWQASNSKLFTFHYDSYATANTRWDMRSGIGGGNTGTRGYSTSLFAAGKWNHVAIVYAKAGTAGTDERVSVYLNGSAYKPTVDVTWASLPSYGASVAFTVCGNMGAGVSGNGTLDGVGETSVIRTSFFDGSVDDVMVIDWPITADQIAMYYRICR